MRSVKIIQLLLFALTLGPANVGLGDSEGEQAQRKFEKLVAVTYVKRGDQELQANLFVPPGKGPFPGVLLVHGGGWVSGTKWQMNAHASRLATAGYTVVAIDYRLAPAHKFPAQIEDCKEAVRWMRKNAKKYKIDPNRLAGYGYSAGGHLVSLLGTTDADDGLEGAKDAEGLPSTRLQAVVAGGAPYEFTWLPETNPALLPFLGATRRDDPEIYKEASPITYVTKDDPPFFLIHGTEDLLVPKVAAERMLKALKDAGLHAEMRIGDKKGHLLTFFDMEIQRDAIKFLDEVLKPEKAD